MDSEEIGIHRRATKDGNASISLSTSLLAEGEDQKPIVRNARKGILSITVILLNFCERYW